MHCKRIFWHACRPSLESLLFLFLTKVRKAYWPLQLWRYIQQNGIGISLTNHDYIARKYRILWPNMCRMGNWNHKESKILVWIFLAKVQNHSKGQRISWEMKQKGKVSESIWLTLIGREKIKRLHCTDYFLVTIINQRKLPNKIRQIWEREQKKTFKIAKLQKTLSFPCLT